MSVPPIIKKFRKNKNKDVLLELQSILDPNYKLCKCCNGSIFYSNIQCRWNNGLVYRGSYYGTVKKIDNKKYNLLICEDCLFDKFPKLKNKKRSIFNTFSIEVGYAFGIPVNILNEKNKEKGITLSNMIKKYGEGEGTLRYERYCEQQSYTNTFEYKNKIHGWDRKEFDKFNKSRAITLSNMIKKYGEVEGTLRYERYCERQSYTNTLAYFIEKYGEDKGREKYRIIQKSKSSFYSKKSQIVFNDLEKNFKNLTFLYATNYGEKYIKCKNKNYFLDCYIPELNLCIEFFGDKFHGNPNLYKKNEYPHPFWNVDREFINNEDKNRIDSLLNEHHIITIVVWEEDYDNNYDKLINKLKNEINKQIDKRK